MIQSEDAGKMTEYHYDDGGRLIERIQPGIGGQPIITHLTYDDVGALTEASHTTDPAGVLIRVLFERDKLGQLIAETQEVRNVTGETVWSHRIEHRYDALGVERQTLLKDLPELTWQTYGSGHLHGLLLDQTPLIDFERDQRHRETERRFGTVSARQQYDALSRLTETGVFAPNLNGTLDRTHHYDSLSQLTQIDTAKGPQRYRYDSAGRLIGASRPGHEETYRFDPAGNRLFPFPGIDLPEHPDALPPAVAGNRIDHDGIYRYRYDAAGNLLLKYQEGDVHYYGYDGAQRLVSYARETPEQVTACNYFYDPLGRRIARQTVITDGQGHVQGEVKTTWYGWDGDRLILTEEDEKRVHTVYYPGSFVPLIRIEGDARPTPPTLAQTLQKLGAPLEAGHIDILDDIEQELRQNRLSAPSLRWLREARLSPEQLVPLLAKEEEKSPLKIHLYHCDHLGTPIALIDWEGKIGWSVELDAWGKVLSEHNPQNLYQPIRMQGQYFDAESELHYNRYRYYDPKTGRYISQDPIGTPGGVNLYSYPINPMRGIDPLGLASCVFDMSTGRLVCTPMNPNNSPVDIPVASGNNSATDAQGKQCRNNSNCTGKTKVGPIPLGTWQVKSNSGNQTSKPNGRVLEPIGATNETENRTLIRTHSCLNPFGPGLGPTFCSEGCVTGTVSDIQKFNSLIDAEPGSMITVIDSSSGGSAFGVEEIINLCGTDVRCQVTFLEYSSKYSE